MTSFLKGLHSLPFRHYSSSCLMFVGKSIKGPNKWLLCILHHHSLCSVKNFEVTPFSFVLHLYGWVSSLQKKIMKRIIFTKAFPCPYTNLIRLAGLMCISLQEYFIRHMDGCTLDTEGEQERVIKCLEAAIQRRVCEVSEISDKIFVLNSCHILINMVDFFIILQFPLKNSIICVQFNNHAYSFF